MSAARFAAARCRWRTIFALAGPAALAACATTPAALLPEGAVAIARQGSFEAGGRIVGEPGRASLACDHGHVEYQIPVAARPVAVFLWHSSSAAVWQRRWDGGEGYQSKILRAGYPTYLWDGPRVGRGTWACEEYIYTAAAGRDQRNFTAWRFGPRIGEFHDNVQFPAGDAKALDQANRARYLEFDTVANAQLQSDAAAAAMDRIGPAVLLTSSAGGFRALLTRLKSDNVKGIVAYENPGYVFPASLQSRLPQGPFGPVYVSDDEFDRLTQIPIQIVWGDHIEDSADWTRFHALSLQFAEIANARGGQVEVLRLPDAGLAGNTHIPFADLNNDKVAELLFAWMAGNGF